MQIGIRNVKTFANGEDIVEIQDITEFVHSQYPSVKANALDRLIMPKEEVYAVSDADLIKRWEIASWQNAQNSSNNNNENNKNNNNNNTSINNKNNKNNKNKKKNNQNKNNNKNKNEESESESGSEDEKNSN